MTRRLKAGIVIVASWSNINSIHGDKACSICMWICVPLLPRYVYCCDTVIIRFLFSFFLNRNLNFCVILWCPGCAVLLLFQRGAPLYPKSVRFENKQGEIKSNQRVVLHKWTIHQTIMTIIYVFFLSFILSFIALKALFNSALCLLCKPKILKSQTEGNHLGPFGSTEGLMECRNFTLVCMFLSLSCS